MISRSRRDSDKTKSELEKVKIDVVEETHRIRERLAGLSQDEIRARSGRVKQELERISQSP